MKTCYYELLGVEATATEHELKKAYRKKALLLHPDKNRDNIDEATAQFAIVRAAYEVLSDSQERAWYDSHKNSILRDDDDFDNEVASEDLIIPSISVDELLRYFNPGLYTRIDDSQYGFYAAVTRIFERLAAEEVTHGKSQQLPKFNDYKDDDTVNVAATDASFLLYPRFGSSNTDYATQIRQFYNSWSSFQTVKSFNWRDEYRYSMAPDRKTRRLMERENKKLRDMARKEFNETVRSFVQFIKKRDPRVKVGLENYEKEKKKKKQQSLQEQAAAAAKQQKVRNLIEQRDGYVVQGWQQLSMEELEEFEQMLQDEYDLSTESDSGDSEFEYENPMDDFEIDEFECIICNKFFKNEKQFETHENSNKHRKAVKQLKWQMQKEGIELGIDKEDVDLEEFETASSKFNSECESIHSNETNDLINQVNESELKDLDNKDVKVEDPATIPKEIDTSLKCSNDIDAMKKEYEVDDEIFEEDYKTFKVPNDSELFSVNSIELSSLQNERDEKLATLLSEIGLDKEQGNQDDDDDWSMPNKKANKKNRKKKKNLTSNSSSSQPSIKQPTPEPNQTKKKKNKK